jgi:hypothetical protein
MAPMLLRSPTAIPPKHRTPGTLRAEKEMAGEFVHPACLVYHMRRDWACVPNGWSQTWHRRLSMQHAVPAAMWGLRAKWLESNLAPPFEHAVPHAAAPWG